MTRWIDRPEDAPGSLPVALVAAAEGALARRALLRGLVAALLGGDPRGVEIRHERGRPPALIAPAAPPLHLSSASRDGCVALAVADRPIGIDIERVEPGAEIPWRVLHEGEAAWLRSLADSDRSRALARLWTVKEAYLKALGIGLAREPDSFQVSFVDGSSARIGDLARHRRAKAETRWVTESVCVSLVA